MILTAHVKTRAKINELESWIDKDTVKISVTAPPERGKANAAVLRILAEHFNISISKIKLLRGYTTPIKHFEILEKSPHLDKNRKKCYLY